MNKTKKQIAAEDVEFHKLLEDWVYRDDKKAYERLWFLVKECTESIIKKRTTGISLPDFDGKVMDTVCDVMKKIQKLKAQNSVDVPPRLVYFIWPYSSWPLYAPATKFAERQLSLDQYLENKAEEPYYEIEYLGEEDE